MLAAASSYFKTLLTVNTKEKNQKHVFIKDVTSLAFGMFLEFIYTGKTNISITFIEEILQASCMFQLWALRDKCVETIKNNLLFENCLEMWMLCYKYDLIEIEQSAKRLVLKNAETILKSREALTNLHHALFEVMLKSDELLVPNEDLLFEALKEWIKAKDEERNLYFCRLYQLIRLPMMSKEYIREIIMKNEHVYKDCSQCLQFSNEMIYLTFGNKTIKL